MSRKLFLVLAVAVLLLSGCGSGKGRTASVPQTRIFPAGPAVPSVISDQGEILEWTVMHFWDSFTDVSQKYHCDSSIINGVRSEEMNNVLAGYLQMLERCPVETAQKAISNLFDKAEASEAADTTANVFEYITAGISNYLYDPNSFLRNEDIYLPFVKKLASSEYVAKDKRESYAYDARMCSLNRFGTVAADFRFTLTNGKAMMLHGIKADWTLLFFSNPGCSACEEIDRAFNGNAKVSALIKSGKLAIANIYIDEEIDKWLGYCSSYPSEWYNGYDQDYVIRKDLLYNVRAIPSLYVLDSEKRVVMKDVPVEKVLSFLEYIQ